MNLVPGGPAKRKGRPAHVSVMTSKALQALASTLSGPKWEASSTGNKGALEADAKGASAESGVERRSSKRVRKQRTAFDPVYSSSRRASAGSGEKPSKRQRSNGSTGADSEMDIPEWPRPPPKLKERGVYWSEIKESSAKILGMSSKEVCQVVRAVSDFLAARPRAVSISWEALVKEKGLQMTPQEARRVWRATAYALTPEASADALAKVAPPRIPGENGDGGEESDLENRRIARRQRHRRDGAANVRGGIPAPPYVRLSVAEAFEGTGLPRIMLDAQFLPSWAWKKEDDFKLVQAVLAAKSESWDQIEEALKGVLPVRASVLRKRFVQLEKNIREDRYKTPRIVEKMKELMNNHAKLLKRILARAAADDAEDAD